MASSQLQTLPVDTVVVGSSSTEVVAANPRREYLLFINDSDEDIFLNFGEAATTAGLPIAANRGAYELQINSVFVDKAINAICVSGGKNLIVLEGT